MKFNVLKSISLMLAIWLAVMAGCANTVHSLPIWCGILAGLVVGMLCLMATHEKP